MPLQLNGTEAKELWLNGMKIDKAYLNGTEVYTSGPFNYDAISLSSSTSYSNFSQTGDGLFIYVVSAATFETSNNIIFSALTSATNAEPTTPVTFSLLNDNNFSSQYYYRNSNLAFSSSHGHVKWTQSGNAQEVHGGAAALRFAPTRTLIASAVGSLNPTYTGGISNPSVATSAGDLVISVLLHFYGTEITVPSGYTLIYSSPGIVVAYAISSGGFVSGGTWGGLFNAGSSRSIVFVIR